MNPTNNTSISKMNNFSEKSNSSEEIRKLIDEYSLQQLINESNKKSDKTPFKNNSSNIDKTLAMKINQLQKQFYEKKDIINSKHFLLESTFDIFNSHLNKIKKVRNLGANRLKPLGIHKTHQEYQNAKNQQKSIYNTSSVLNEETDALSAETEIGIINLRNRSISTLVYEPNVEDSSDIYNVPDNSFDEANENIDLSSSDELI